MKGSMTLGLFVILGVMMVNMAHAAERVVVCEELYQEG
jgi:hypothetical protein